ncbi:MAG: hypothetical protein WC716_14125 [Chitinophagaceae bacterium]
MFRLVFVLMLCCGLAVHAQKIKKEDYFFIDRLVQEAGPMKGYSLSYIVDSITKDCKTELQSTRAFYRWEALFVAFDTRRFCHPANTADNASTALMERKAAGEGFAQLFKAMCDLKKIDCVVVKGLLRRRLKDIGQVDEDAVHYWNVITIHHTSYLVDASLSGGLPDEKGKHFMKEYTDAWWLCNRKLFVCTHLPDDKSMQLLEIPVTKSEFAQGPLVLPGAIVAGLVPTKTVKGLLRGVADSSAAMKFNFAGNLDLSTVQVSFDEGKRLDVPFDFDEFGIYLNLPNGPAGKHVADVYIKNKTAFRFRTEMRPALKKKNQSGAKKPA